MAGPNPAISMFNEAVDLAKINAAYPSREYPTNGTLYAIVNIGRKRYFNLCGADTSEGSPVLGWPIDGREPANNEKVRSLFLPSLNMKH